MSVPVGLSRIRKTILWVAIFFVALFAIPEILTTIWLKIQSSITISGTQFGSGHTTIVAGCVVAAVLAMWILAGFAKS